MLYIVDFYIVTRIIIKNDSVQNTIFLCTFRFGGYTFTVQEPTSVSFIFL